MTITATGIHDRTLSSTRPEQTSLYGYEAEPYDVLIVVTSDLDDTDIASAELRIADAAAVTLTPGAHTGGYQLTGSVTLAGSGVKAWAVEVTDTDGNTPVVVAAGSLEVFSRMPVDGEEPLTFDRVEGGSASVSPLDRIFGGSASFTPPDSIVGGPA